MCLDEAEDGWNGKVLKNDIFYPLDIQGIDFKIWNAKYDYVFFFIF